MHPSSVTEHKYIQDVTEWALLNYLNNIISLLTRTLKVAPFGLLLCPKANLLLALVAYWLIISKTDCSNFRDYVSIQTEKGAVKGTDDI